MFELETNDGNYLSFDLFHAWYWWATFFTTFPGFFGIFMSPIYYMYSIPTMMYLFIDQVTGTKANAQLSWIPVSPV